MRGLFFAVFLLLLSVSYSIELSGYVHDGINSTDESYWDVVRPAYEKGIIAFAGFEACSENYGKFSYVVSGENSEYEYCGSFEIEKAKITNKPEIAVFESEIMNNGMSVSWETAYYLLVVEGRRYLNDQAQIINATGINEEIQGDVVVLPDFSYGYREEVVESISEEGCENLRNFAENGGMVFASGNALLILNKCELVDVGDNVMNGEYNISINEEIGEEEFLVSGMDGDVVINNAPEIISEGVVVLAEADGTPVIAYKEYGKGFIVFTNANLLPYDDYEVFVNALMSAKSSKIGIEAEVITNASAENGLEENDVPALEPDVSIQVINKITNYWNEDVEAVFYEEISDKFEYDSSEPEAEVDGNNLNWSIVLSGGELRNLSYTAKTKNGTVDGYVLLSTAHAEYENKSIKRENLYVNGKMSARLVGDRDIELDGWYPLPAEGVYFDIALPIENKEETMAKNITVVDIVVLKSPIVDVSNQSKLARARNESFVKGNNTYEVVQVEDENRTVYVNNTIYFYKKDGTFFMFYGPGGMIEDYAGHESEFKYPVPVYVEEIEYTYESDGQEYTLPALKMVYEYGQLNGYDYEEPAIRYGIYSQEEGGRTVSFESDPINNTIICEGGGGSVYTNIGIHPIPYHEYLDYDEVYIPETTTGEISRMDYRDAWERSKTTELRTVFWDIVPFPPPEEHAVTSTTYEIKVDGRRVQILPADLNSTLHLRIGVFNGYPPYDPDNYPYNMTIPYNESLIAESIPKGVGFKIEYTGWDSPHDKVGLTDQFYTDSLHTLIFNIELPPSELRIINVHADIETDYETQRKEGLFKIDEGARQVYHQIAVGPNRYEVLDSRVKVVRGEAPYVKGERRVSPVNIHTRGGNVYYNILLSDIYEPHKFSEPMIQSYGFGDVSATTYVGTRIKNRMYYAIIQSGDETVVRVEITNTKDVNLTDVEITPVVPEGWEYERLELMRDELPIFYDWEFLAERINGNIPPAWKGVWYYKITSPNDAENGVYEIPFEVEGNNLPNNFEVPPARISVGGGNDVVYSIPKDVVVKLNLEEHADIAGVKLCSQEDTEQILGTLDGSVYEGCEELEYTINGNVLNIDVGDFTESEIMNKQNKSIIILMNVTPPHGGVVYLDNGYTILYSSDDGFVREKKDSRRMHITATGPYLVETKDYEIYVNGKEQEMLQYGKENIVVLHLRYYNNGNDIAYDSNAGYVVNGIPNSLLADMGAILPTQTYLYTTNITVIPRGGRMHILLSNGTLEFYDKLHDLRLNLLLDDLLIPVNKTSDDSSGITRRFSVAIEKCPLNISVYYDSRPKQARIRVLRILGGSGGVSEIYDNETSKAVLELENGDYKVEISDSGFETYEKDVSLNCIEESETRVGNASESKNEYTEPHENEEMKENSEGVEVTEKTEGNLRVKEYKSDGRNIKVTEQIEPEKEQKNSDDNSMWILALIGGAAVVIVILGGFVYSAIKE